MKKLLILTAIITIFFSCNSEKKVEKITQRIVALGENIEEIRFKPSTLTFPSNATIEITLVNASEHPSLFHNIVFCTFGKTNEIGFKAIKAGKKNNYIPLENSDVLKGSDMLNPGDSLVFDFTAPAAGKYSYVCTFPGHYQTMVGTLNIEAN